MGGGDGHYDEGRVIIEKPHFLDISFADAHTIASISTLGWSNRTTTTKRRRGWRRYDV
jgi:hypothetical protein